MNHQENCTITADDMEAVAAEISKAAAEVRAGDVAAFDRMFVEGGTEEGDAKINYLCELLLIRHSHRLEQRAASGRQE